MMKTMLFALAILTATPASAQVITAPPRSITSQQETPGVDSTFQGDVVPNTQSSSITINTDGTGGAGVPTAPPPTPTPAPAPLPPLPLSVAGQTFFSMGVGVYVGGFIHGGGQVNVTFSNGTYQIVGYGGASPGTLAAGTWLPAGRVASDFTVKISASVDQLQNEPASPVYPAASAFPPTLATWTNTQPTNNTASTWRGVGISDSTVSVNGAGNVGVMAGGGEFFSNRAASPTGVYISANITVTITDNRYGGSSYTTFTIAGGE